MSPLFLEEDGNVPSAFVLCGRAGLCSHGCRLGWHLEEYLEYSFADSAELLELTQPRLLCN